MKKYSIACVVVLGVLLLIAAFLFWLSNNELLQKNITQGPPYTKDASVDLTNINPAPTATISATHPSADDVPEEMQWINAPINFWGKVIDERGNPVPDATISYTAMDKPLEQIIRDQGTRYTGKSDADGLFSITDIKGGSLYVGVSKDGYYRIKKSGYTIGYGIPNEHKPPSPNEPAIFVLRKMGETEPLKAFSSGGIRVPKDGQPIEVSLTQGRVMPAGQGDIQIEVWTQDQQRDAQGYYPWRCKISVPGGGLIERNDNFDFIAPAEGYEPTVEISMNQAADRWQKGFDGQYFVKLRNGTFARMSLRLTTGGDHFFMIESFLNPTPGSRNLEYDPKQAVKAP